MFLRPCMMAVFSLVQTSNSQSLCVLDTLNRKYFALLKMIGVIGTSVISASFRRDTI